MATNKTYNSVGRRKKSVARAFLTSGKGKIIVNDKKLDDYFETDNQKNLVLSPLNLIKMKSKFDITLTVKGGGKSSQADAIKLAIARALIEFDPNLRADLKPEEMLKVDSRKKERKKYGHKKARKSPQFSKR
ncbi:MAG: 30S ribosomal protein S9 [Candidatus Woesearchaeota archaeon]